MKIFNKREYTLEKMSTIFQVMLSLGCFIFVWWFMTSPSEVQIESVYGLKNSLIVIAVIWFLLLNLFRMGKIAQKENYFHLFITYFLILLIGISILFAFNNISHYSALEMESVLLFGVFNLFVLVTYKKSFFTIMHFFRRNSNYVRQILVIADEGSANQIEKIIQTKDWRYNIYGIMTCSKNTETKYKNRFKIIPETKKLDELLREETIDELIYCKSENNQNEIHSYITNCAEVGISFHHYNERAPNKNESEKKSSSFYLIDQLPLVTYKNTPDNYLGLKMKSAFDYLFSLTVILLGSPIFLAIAIAIKLEDGGPVFFKQERTGLNGRRFPIFKFRTMVANAESLKLSLLGQNEQNGPVFKIANDPRVTRVGLFLRKTSFDELPQFFNVLRGEMSVVGPRPPIPLEVEKYQRWQKRRLSMKPGITCIWQVSGRNNIPFEQWMKLDLEYIDKWSFTRDLELVLKTVKVMLEGNGR